MKESTKRAQTKYEHKRKSVGCKLIGDDIELFEKALKKSGKSGTAFVKHAILSECENVIRATE